MTDIVERLRHLTLDTGWLTGDEAADTITALRKRLEVVDGWSESVDGISCRDDTIKLQDAEIEALRQEVKAMHTAGDKLGYYAGHADDCEDVTGEYPGSCSCGYRAAWQQWRLALGDKL